MPESLNTQQQIWVTLPQALRWIMAGEMPTLENREALPTCPSAHTSRADLFSFWIDGRLKLYGLDGYDPNRPWTPLKSSLTYEYDCWKGTDLAWISPQVIKQANFDSIDWEHGTLGRFHLLKHEDDSHPYFIDLRVRWDDLHGLIPGKAASVEMQSHSNPKTRLADTSKKQKSKNQRSDWPLLVVLSAMVGDRKPAFWKSSRAKMLLLLQPVVDVAGDAEEYRRPGHYLLPVRSSFEKVALPILENATALIAEHRSSELPVTPYSLPLIAALVAIVREHDHEPGEMPEQIKLLLKVAADMGGSGFSDLSDIDLFKAAKAVEKQALEIHKKFCRKPPLGSI